MKTKPISITIRMMRLQGFIYFIAIAFAIILSCNTSDALTCYSCRGEGCDTMTSVQLIECQDASDEGQTICYKASVFNVPTGINGGVRHSVERGCGYTTRWINTCRDFEFSPGYECEKCFCPYDYCNKGNYLKCNNIISFSLMILISFF